MHPLPSKTGDHQSLVNYENSFGCFKQWVFRSPRFKKTSPRFGKFFVVNPREAENALGMPFFGASVCFCGEVTVLLKHRRECWDARTTGSIGSAGSAQPRHSPLTPASCPSSHPQRLALTSGCSSCMLLHLTRWCFWASEWTVAQGKSSEKSCCGNVFTYSFSEKWLVFINLLWNVDYLCTPTQPCPSRLRQDLSEYEQGGPRHYLEQIGEDTTPHGVRQWAPVAVCTIECHFGIRLLVHWACFQPGGVETEGVWSGASCLDGWDCVSAQRKA